MSMLLIVCWVIMPIVGSIIAYILFPEAIDKDFERREEKKRKRRPLTKEEQEAIDVAVMTSEMYNSSHK